MGIVLAIEAAIGGGSVAVLSDERVLGKWHGEGPAARSEQLLKVIGDLLDETSVSKSSISRVAVSNGPGSYTGIRIGIATAMGLSHALSIPVAGISALRAIAFCYDEPNKLIVLPIGRSGYCWQVFSGSGEDAKHEPPASGNAEALLEGISRYPDTPVIAHAAAIPDISSFSGNNAGSIVDFGYDVAVSIGTATARIDEGLTPFYARETLLSQTSSR